MSARVESSEVQVGVRSKETRGKTEEEWKGGKYGSGIEAVGVCGVVRR